jgi:hypothetical protein
MRVGQSRVCEDHGVGQVRRVNGEALVGNFLRRIVVLLKNEYILRKMGKKKKRREMAWIW